MCGILGGYTKQEQQSFEGLMVRTLEWQKPRGPDYSELKIIEGPETATTSFLGHNRLSIIDLSEAAHQPMSSACGRYDIVFNGEIFNYLELRAELRKLDRNFKTDSDTEVLLEAFAQWGTSAFNKFNGMFAFCIYDRKDGSFTLVRDRFGIKPLFYVQKAREMAFASSVTPLAKHYQLKPNKNYLAESFYTLTFEDSTDKSPFDGLKSLPPGHFIEIKSDKTPTVPKAYYNLEQKIKSLSGLEENEILEKVEDLLLSSISLRQRADVPVALSLSGGLDSSLIAIGASQNKGDLHAFCFGSPDDPSTEAPIALRLCQKHKINPHFIWPSHQEIYEAFDQVLTAQEAPFGNLSVLAQNFIFKSIRASGFKVAMGGQGADEAFMGYRKYQLFHLLDLRKNKGRFHRETTLQALQLFRVLAAELFHIKTYTSQIKRYFSSQKINSPLQPFQQTSLGLQINENLQMRQLRDITNTSLPTLLRYEDRNSMGSSVESRLPFLDYRLMELGLSLPTNLKVTQAYGKYALRNLPSLKVPRKISRARFKKGFEIPKDLWIERFLGPHLRHGLKTNENLLEDFCNARLDIDLNYSNQKLQSSPHRLTEAIGLYWAKDFL